MDARIKSGHDRWVLWGEANELRTHTNFTIFKQQNKSRRDVAPRDAMRPSCAFIFRPQGGRGECRVPAAPAASCALCIGRTHTSNNEYTGTPGIPARNGFNGLCRALPGDRALLPPSSAEQGFVTARLGQQTSANLTPASGRQDHTILPSANNISRQRAVDRSQVFRPALRSRRAQNAAASIASLPAFVTMANAPLWGGMRKF
jgi:hypothetical protein